MADSELGGLHYSTNACFQSINISGGGASFSGYNSNCIPMFMLI